MTGVKSNYTIIIIMVSNDGLKLKIEYRTGVKPNYNDGLKLKIEYRTGV